MMDVRKVIIQEIEERGLNWYDHLKIMHDERVPLNVWIGKREEVEKYVKKRESWMNTVEGNVMRRGL